MNKVGVFILALAVLFVLGCDTKDNVKPRNENFFVKMYDGVQPGDQFGADIIETSDGGLLIAGTGGPSNSVNSEIILIKTDNKGNIIWKFGSSSIFGINSAAQAQSIIEVDDGYIVGCNITGGDVFNDNLSRGLLLKMPFSGDENAIDTTYIRTLDNSIEYPNVLKKISALGLGSNVIVCGETSRPRPTSTNINGYISRYSADLVNLPSSTGKNAYFNSDNSGDITVVGAYEIADSIGSNSTKYIIFGNSENSDSRFGQDFFYIGFDEDFGSNYFQKYSDLSGDQYAYNSCRIEDNFYVIGEQNSLEIVMSKWRFFDTGDGYDWSPITRSISSSNRRIGKAINASNLNNLTLVADEFIQPASEIYLSRLDENLSERSVGQRLFGTTSSTYSSSAVTLLQDGSIVIVGTADLDPIKKILVIKTGPNGEMSF